MSVERLLRLLKTMEQDDNLNFVYVKQTLTMVYLKGPLTEATHATVQEFCELAKQYPDAILVNSKYTVYPQNYPKPLLHINWAIG